MSLRLKKRGEKALERALVVASPVDDDTLGKNSAHEAGPSSDISVESPRPRRTKRWMWLQRRDAETADGS